LIRDLIWSILKNSGYFSSFLERREDKIMNPKFRILLVFLALCIGEFLCAPQTHGVKTIAKIAGLRGEVIILSGEKVSLATNVGQTLFQGDRMQTAWSEVQIAFNDGAVMYVKPFTSIMIQEREEEERFWVLKGRKGVRRITCFVGKIRFDSGTSKRKHYLQSPTAVCELSGSDADFGYDNLSTYLGIYKGKADCRGKVIREFFPDPRIDAAAVNKVYQSLAKAHEKAKQARATGKALNLAEAKLGALEAGKVAAAELLKNPDALVSREAEVVSTATDASIAAAQAEIILEELEELRRGAEEAAKEAKTAGDEEAAKKSKEAAEKAEQAAELTKEDVEKAEKAAEEARRAAKQLELEKVRDAAARAEKALENAKYFAKGIIEIPVEELAPPEPVKPAAKPKFEFPIGEEPPIQDTEPASAV
jgi:hypothetical protein